MIHGLESAVPGFSAAIRFPLRSPAPHRRGPPPPGLGSGTTALPIPYAKERRMTDTTNSISDLIEISEDGMAFYEEAAQKVKDQRSSHRCWVLRD